MADSEVIRYTVTQIAIEAPKAIVLAMTEASEESRMPTTGTGEGKSEECVELKHFELEVKIFFLWYIMILVIQKESKWQLRRMCTAEALWVGGKNILLMIHHDISDTERVQNENKIG